jgi:hypothetical protein
MQPTTPPQPEQQDQAKLHPMVVLRPGEKVITEIKRHPYGILSMYFSGALAIGVSAILAAFAPSIFGDTFDDVQSMAYLGVGIITIGIIAMLFLATSIYWQNRWIVTDDSITQITQDGLFGRRVSQLSLESLEDITVDQHGVIQSMFGFGTLHAETAGEKSKFVFQYCPQPNKYARQILQAHELFLHQTRHQPQAVQPIDGAHQQPAPAVHQTYAQQQQPQYTQQQQPMPQQPHPYEQQPPVQPQQPHLPGGGYPPQQQQQPEQPRSNPAIWGR